MANAQLTRTDDVGEIEQLAAGGSTALQRQIATLLTHDRPRLTAALYRLDVDEAAARRLLIAAAHDEELDRVAAGLAELVVRRLAAKLSTTATYQARGDQDPP